jgi:hypothetical protein
MVMASHRKAMIAGLISKPQDRRNEPSPNLRELSDAELLALIQACRDAGAPQVLDRPPTLEEWEALDCKPQVAGLSCNMVADRLEGRPAVETTLNVSRHQDVREYSDQELLALIAAQKLIDVTPDKDDKS